MELTICIDSTYYTLAKLAQKTARESVHHVSADDAMAIVHDLWELACDSDREELAQDVARLYLHFSRKLRKASTVCGWLSRAFSTDEMRYYLTHIYQRNGFAYATDGRLMCAVPAAFMPNPDPDYEGYLDSQGAKIESTAVGRYPDVEAVIKGARDNAGDVQTIALKDLEIRTGSKTFNGKPCETYVLPNGSHIRVDAVRDVVAGYPLFGVPYVKSDVSANVARIRFDSNGGGPVIFEMGDSGAFALVMPMSSR